MRGLHFYIILVVGSIAMGCFSNKEAIDETSQEAPDMHTSRISLDWPGSYIGLLWCDHCGGEFYGIHLEENQNYRLKKVHLGGCEPMSVQSGQFTWTNGDNAVQLGENEVFQVHEFALVQETIYLVPTMKNGTNSSSEKLRFPQVDVGPLANEIPADLLGDWGVYRRFEKNGKVIENTFSTLSFTDGGKIRGESACNAYHGTFSVPATHRLDLSPISSTKMSCPNLSAEKEYYGALSQATYYFRFGEYLIIISEDLQPLIWALGKVK